MKGRAKRKLFLVVSDDEYELPMFVGDSRKEVADFLGIDPVTVTTYIKREGMKRNGYKIVTVTIPEDDFDENEDW